MNWVDRLGEGLARGVAHNVSRRSLLSSVSRILVGSAFIMPVLPISRIAHAEEGGGAAAPANGGDPTNCEYWRHCALDGFQCSCCGGTLNSCPAGSEASPISWVGTCHNPHENKNYVVAYHDCCGKTACGRCYCGNQVDERPGYEFFRHNDVDWCMANRSAVYHCTVSLIVGPAT